MYNDKNNKQSNLKRSSDEYEEEYEFLEVNAATGDQYRKFSNIRSKDGKISPEMVREFHNNSSKEAREFKRNNPEVRNVTFRELRDENDKQIMEILPGGQLIFPTEFRVRVYDENGREIIGEENIRREIAKREEQWDRWEREGKLQVLDHQIHDFSDGSVVSIYFRIPPVKTLHQNEINDITSPIENLSKRLKANDYDKGDAMEVDYSADSSQQSNRVLIESIKQNIKDWRIDKILISKGMVYGGKCEMRLVHREANIAYDKKGNLIVDSGKIYHPNFFTHDEWDEIGQARSHWKEIRKQKSKDYDKLSKSELVDLLVEAKDENERLKKEIEELKSLPQQTPEVLQEINRKETQLQASTSFLDTNSSILNENNPNEKKMGIFVFSIGAIFSLVFLVIYRSKKMKRTWTLKQPKKKNQS